MPPGGIKATPAWHPTAQACGDPATSALPTTTFAGYVGDPKKGRVMVPISQLHSMAEERTATSISLGRFVALLHRWAKRFCPGYNPCERKRLTGYPYLTQCETSAFLLWLESLPKHCLLSPDYPPVCFRKSSHISSSCSPS